MPGGGGSRETLNEKWRGTFFGTWGTGDNFTAPDTNYLPGHYIDCIFNILDAAEADDLARMLEEIIEAHGEEVDGVKKLFKPVNVNWSMNALCPPH